MAQAIPPVPRGLGLSRELINYLEALRLAVGGDSATTAPSAQARVLAPVATVITPRTILAPVSVGLSVTVGLS